MKYIISISLYLIICSSLTYASSKLVSCETGDPSGGGPSAYLSFENLSMEDFVQIDLAWNPKNIDLSATRHLSKSVHPKNLKMTKDQFGEIQIQADFDLTSDIQLQYIESLDNGPVSVMMKSSGHKFDDTEMSCQ